MPSAADAIKTGVAEQRSHFPAAGPLRACWHWTSELHATQLLLTHNHRHWCRHGRWPLLLAQLGVGLLAHCAWALQNTHEPSGVAVKIVTPWSHFENDGLFVLHCVSLLHATHVLLPEQIGVAPEQSLVPVVNRHRGVAPLQSALLRHWTHVPSATEASTPVSHLGNDALFVRHWLLRLQGWHSDDALQIGLAPQSSRYSSNMPSSSHHCRQRQCNHRPTRCTFHWSHQNPVHSVHCKHMSRQCT